MDYRDQMDFFIFFYIFSETVNTQPNYAYHIYNICIKYKAYRYLQIENHGMIKTAVGIAKQEGVLKLWSGLMPMFQRHAIYSGSRLMFYEYFRSYLKDEKGKVSLGAASVGKIYYLY